MIWLQCRSPGIRLHNSGPQSAATSIGDRTNPVTWILIHLIRETIDREYRE
jgi:hypothetical protein